MIFLRKPKPRFKYNPKRKRRAPVRFSAAVLAAAEAAVTSDEFRAWLERYEQHREQYPYEPFEEPPP
jgi:hypothetical protein